MIKILYNVDMSKCFLFDFDGTLVNSMPTYTKAVTSILDNENITYGADLIKTITPLGYKGTAEYYKDNFPINLTVDEMIDLMRDKMYHAYLNDILAKDTVIDTLYTLKSQGHSLNVLTASPHIVLDACLKRLGIYDLFDNVWSCEDFMTTKADPDIYVRCAEKLGVGIEDVIFLDDNYDADSTAKKAGAKVIGVYDDFSRDYVSKMKEICDSYIYKFEELVK